MKRAVIDQIAREYRLSEPAIDAAFALTWSRPDAEAWRAFAVRLCHASGVAAIGAGAIFFIAANWQAFGAVGHFALLQGALLACAGVAGWRPPPHVWGSAAMVLAILVTGGLLALFGQTYQTGADAFELFFYWAALSLPFALAASSGAAWAVWWVVLNVALALYCGWLGTNHFLWSWLDRGPSRPFLLLIPAAVNLAGAALYVYLARTRFAAHAPRWLVRLLLALGFLYGTIAAIGAVAEFDWGTTRAASEDRMFVVAAFALVCVAVAVATLRRRSDVFPMALIIASWIAISTAMLVVNIRLKDIGAVFLVAAWLIGTSTAAGFVLMRWVRTWRFDDDEDDAREARA